MNIQKRNQRMHQCIEHLHKGCETMNETSAVAAEVQEHANKMRDGKIGSLIRLTSRLTSAILMSFNMTLAVGQAASNSHKGKVIDFEKLKIDENIIPVESITLDMELSDTMSKCLQKFNDILTHSVEGIHEGFYIALQSVNNISTNLYHNLTPNETYQRLIQFNNDIESNSLLPDENKIKIEDFRTTHDFISEGVESYLNMGDNFNSVPYETMVAIVAIMGTYVSAIIVIDALILKDRDRFGDRIRKRIMRPKVRIRV